jgi:outer membrane protease
LAIEYLGAIVTVHSLSAVSAAVLSAMLVIGGAQAGELGSRSFEASAGAVTVSGGLGVLALQGDEFVYEAPGSGNAISHLIWASFSPVLTTGMNVQLPEGWTLAAKADISASGVGVMDDYDWIGPNRTSFDPDQWTHHSLSSNSVDWYFDGQVLAGRDLRLGDTSTVNVNAGFSYTDLRWTATGGSFTYSDVNVGDGCGFRGCSGTFANVPVLTYRQQFPALIAGADFHTQQGDWTLGASAHGGLTFSAVTTDDHWLRSRTVVDTLSIAPVVSVTADASYKMSDKTALVLSGGLTKIFVGRGNASYTYHDGSFPDASLTDQNGDGLVSATMSVGMKGHF